MISARSLNANRSISKLINVKKCFSSSTAPSSGKLKEKISIPPRIVRGPTDILKALASTVGKDYTAPHYKYHDDPFFIPYSNNLKRSYALSKESGRRAAKYFLTNFPELFHRDDAEPKVPNFSYKYIYEETDDLNVDDLMNCIQTRQVPEAMNVYRWMSAKNVEIPSNVKQQLLELVCFYNSSEEDQVDKEEYLEELWFKNPKVNEIRKSWADELFAEELFSSMEKDAKAYCAIILGLGKYNRSEKAFQYFDEMKEKNFDCNVHVYNTLIENVPYVRESSETRWELIIELLDKMNRDQIRPNLATFNAALDVLVRSYKWRNCKNNSLLLFNEMKRLNIQPSLATYHFLVLIFYKDRSKSDPLLYEILRELSGKAFTIRHPKDVYFFKTAMEVCNHNLGDINAAYSLHAFLQIGDNQKFIGDSFKESGYYNNFFKLHCLSETADKLMEVYNLYVPNTYVPEASLMFEIINALELYDAHNYLPQIWSDILFFDMINRENIVENILRVMSKSKMDDDQLQKQFSVIAADLIKRNEEVDEGISRKKFFLSGVALVDCFKIFVNSEEIAKAMHVLNYLKENKADLIGSPTGKDFMKFIKLLATKGNDKQILKCVSYADEYDLTEVRNYLRENAEKLSLSEDVKQSLNDYQK